jgi:hypothetical protein
MRWRRSPGSDSAPKLRLTGGLPEVMGGAAPLLGRDFHSNTRSQGVAGLATLMHTPEVDQRTAPVHLTGRASL